MPASLAQSEQSTRTRSKKKFAAIAVLVILGVLVLPPLKTVNRFRNRLESAMSAAVGRSVTVSDVSLRLLPRPGFELHGFVIHDDPAMSAEPLLRADRVNADLRLGSLWRGRIEIARLDLQAPSLNLVRSPSGVWNFEQLLAHAYNVPLAPTANARGEARPRFPYIDATGGRINLKVGQEKKVYALTDADFALWLATEDEWQMRLAGRPVRTDADLGDTGTLRLSGGFTRSPAPRQAPLRFTVALQNSQLGQLSQLIYGRDRGWRGGVDVEAELSGSSAALNIAGRISVRDFRRYDITVPDLLDFVISCQGVYTPAAARLQPAPGAVSGSCTLPRDQGILNLTGSYDAPSHAGKMVVVAAAFPVAAALDFARHMKLDTAPDLTGDGTLNGSLVYASGAPSSERIEPMAVRAERNRISTMVAHVTLRGQELTPALDLGVLAFNLEQPEFFGNARRPSVRHRGDATRTTFSLMPAPIALGGATPAMISATADHDGYQFVLKGEADLGRARAFVSALGLPASELKGTGRARLDLRFENAWARFAAPEESGSVKPEAQHPVLAREH